MKEEKMKVYIMRGIPGSGKSTRVREILEERNGGVVASADNYFMVDGEYKFNPRFLKNAHKFCWDLFVEALENNEETVVVDNTNIRRWEYERYVQKALSFGYEVEIVAISHIPAELAAERNTHGVPLKVIERMIENWED